MQFIHFTEAKEKVALLRRIREFKRISTDELSRIANVMRWQTVEAGTEILTEGKASNEVYFIAQGLCRAFKRHFDAQTGHHRRIFIGEYKALDVVGEEPVLSERHLAAVQTGGGVVKLVDIASSITVKTMTRVKLAVFNGTFPPVVVF
jgi:CRP-like cAMP-binding protein